MVSATPAGQVALQISTGSRHACALTFDAELVNLQHLALKTDTPESNAAFLNSLVPVCWGSSGPASSDNLVPPAIGDAADNDPVVSVRAGDGFTCVRTFKGRVQCSGAYGSQPGAAELLVPDGVLFSALTVGEKHVAGVVMDTADLRAWGDCSSLNECTAPSGVTWAGAEGSLSAGRMFTCALDTQLRPHCWGRTFWPRGTPVASEFIEINSGMSHTCGIRRNDTRAACWGECSFGEYVCFDDGSGGGGGWRGIGGYRWAVGCMWVGWSVGPRPCGSPHRLGPSCRLPASAGSPAPPAMTLVALVRYAAVVDWWIVDFFLLPCAAVALPLLVGFFFFLRRFFVCPRSPPRLFPARRCDPPVEFNRIPCERHAARGTCLRSVSSGVCESRACTAGYTWRFDAPCGCFYKLSSISVANAGATVGGRSDGSTDCHKVAGVPFFFMDRADQTNQAPRCQG